MRKSFTLILYKKELDIVYRLKMVLVQLRAEIVALSKSGLRDTETGDSIVYSVYFIVFTVVTDTRQLPPFLFSSIRHEIFSSQLQTLKGAAE